MPIVVVSSLPAPLPSFKKSFQQEFANDCPRLYCVGGIGKRAVRISSKGSLRPSHECKPVHTNKWAGRKGGCGKSKQQHGTDDGVPGGLLDVINQQTHLKWSVATCDWGFIHRRNVHPQQDLMRSCYTREPARSCARESARSCTQELERSCTHELERSCTREPVKSYTREKMGTGASHQLWQGVVIWHLDARGRFKLIVRVPVICGARRSASNSTNGCRAGFLQG
jgi:hypothetical protein